MRCQVLKDSFIYGVIEEAKDLSTLHHKNLVSFIGVSTYEDIFCVSLREDSRNLYDIARDRSVSLEVNEVINYAKQIAEGLEYLHSHNKIHKSLKSKNVLITKNNNTVKLCDYGFETIKWFVSSHQGVSPQAPEYNAPEILTRQQFDKQVDAYSFAIVILEMLLRGDPFGSLPPKTIIAQVINDKIRPVIPDNVPTVFRKMIEGCWQQDPAPRPTFSVIVKILSQSPDRLLAY